ncbi:F-box/FBD/LRR-repeat protein-like protein [Tanacetum coccineum]
MQKKATIFIYKWVNQDDELQLSEILSSSLHASPMVEITVERHPYDDDGDLLPDTKPAIPNDTSLSGNSWMANTRISKLPPAITETILCLVPIEDAARTSVLSKEWRYSWTKIPKLVFNEYIFKFRTSPTRRCPIRRKLPSISLPTICKVLNEGTIDELTIEMNIRGRYRGIDDILDYLSQKIIKKLKLEFLDNCILPSSLFSLTHLTDLCLISCALDRDLLGLDSLGRLKTLHLEDLTASIENLVYFLSKCPSLKTVTVIPRLGPVLGLLLRSSPHLERLVVTFGDFERSFRVEEFSDIWLEHLSEKGDYYKYLAEFKSSNDKKEVADQSLRSYQIPGSDLNNKIPELTRTDIVICVQSDKVRLDTKPAIPNDTSLSGNSWMANTRQRVYLEMDRISKLPHAIRETILCLVPIKDAARTSVLSKEWRYSWTQIPKLVFNEYIFKFRTSPTRRRPMRRKLPSISLPTICKVLNEGTIDELTIEMNIRGWYRGIDDILDYLSQKIIKKLKLEFLDNCILPSSLFSLTHLTDLCLISCALDRDSLGLDSLGRLKTLHLEDLTASIENLVYFLSKCPSLKTVTVMQNRYSTGSIYDTKTSTIIDMFECLPMIENLSINSKIIEIPRLGPVLGLLLRSSPHLERLVVTIRRSTEYADSDCESDSDSEPLKSKQTTPKNLSSCRNLTQPSWGQWSHKAMSTAAPWFALQD